MVAVVAQDAGRHVHLLGCPAASQGGGLQCHTPCVGNRIHPDQLHDALACHNYMHALQ